MGFALDHGDLPHILDRAPCTKNVPSHHHPQSWQVDGIAHIDPRYYQSV